MNHIMAFLEYITSDTRLKQKYAVSLNAISEIHRNLLTARCTIYENLVHCLKTSLPKGCTA